MKRGFLYLLLLLLLSSACSEHTDDIQPVQPEKNIQFLFVPNQVQPATRADADELLETPIEELTVLAFEKLNGSEDFTYTYHSKAEETNTDNKYKVTLRLSEVPIKLLLIANHTNFQGITVETTIDEAPKFLISGFTAEGISSIPMYGEISFEKVTKEIEIKEDIPLLRSVAAVEVSLKETLYNDGVFTLISAQAYRANNQIQIIPNKSAFGEEEENLKVISPSIPAGTENNVTTERVNAGNGETELAPIFLPESEKKEGEEITSKATCLIVGGIFKGGDPSNTEITYYRIDFKTEVKNGNRITGQLLRNHKYTIEITDVSGPGTTHPEEATSANIKATFQDWGNSDHPIEL